MAKLHALILPIGTKYDPSWSKCLLPFPAKGDGSYALKLQAVKLINEDRLARYADGLGSIAKIMQEQKP